MPRKIRQLKADLRQSGWWQIPGGGKGSHTTWEHEKVGRTVTLSGADGSDAGHYQERDVSKAVRQAKGRK